MKLKLTIRLTRNEEKAFRKCCKRRRIGRGYFVLPWPYDRNLNAIKGRIGANHWTIDSED